MQVLDYDRFSRDDPIGEVAIPLSDLDLAVGQTMWKALQPCKGSSVSGDVMSMHVFENGQWLCLLYFISFLMRTFCVILFQWTLVHSA